MSTLRALCASILLVAALSACAGPTPANPIEPAVGMPAADTQQAATISSGGDNQATPAAATPAQNPAPAAGTIWLQILSPQDGMTVNTQQIEVNGLTMAGAVVTVGDDILLVGEDGKFKVTVVLDEGPNLVEIVASDWSGNEISQLLTVIYEPN